ncbi:cupin domain-containing protein [Planococcus shenhongbingii]|uniref:cupin domain-containing protein n=1 Tax=Planococcus shenhongbingii TaxID=3058398 RepID=UPI002639892A|nr:cupin domain-containing protein [Planococcus sp. N016]WKA56925.1 cupin domain-containing protein [Planococcus sp. N016]
MDHPLNKAFALAQAEGKIFWFLGTLLEVKITGEETNGVFSLLEEIDPPNFSTPLHIHHNEDEFFYILEGKATFKIGDKTIAAKSGTFLFAPRDIAHMYTIEGPAPARILSILMPAGLENFFIETSIPATEYKLPPADVDADMDKLFAAAAKYGVEILD